MSNKDNADVNATTNRDFYPEDAQERNFAEARRLAVENTKKDQVVAAEDTARKEKLKAKEAHKTIPAQPNTKSDTNPEQVKTAETDTSKK